MKEFAAQMMRAIECELNVTEEQLKSKSRKRDIVEARVIFCVMLKNMDKKITLTKLGSYIMKDHSTVVHYFGLHDKLLETDKAYSKKHNQIVKLVLEDTDIEHLINMKIWHEKQVEEIKRKIKFISSYD